MKHKATRDQGPRAWPSRGKSPLEICFFKLFFSFLNCFLYCLGLFYFFCSVFDMSLLCHFIIPVKITPSLHCNCILSHSNNIGSTMQHLYQHPSQYHLHQNLIHNLHQHYMPTYTSTYANNSVSIYMPTFMTTFSTLSYTQISHQQTTIKSWHFSYHSDFKSI